MSVTDLGYTTDVAKLQADTDAVLNATIYQIDRPVNKGRIAVATISAGLISFLYGSAPRDCVVKAIYMCLAEFLGINVAYSANMSNIVGLVSATGYYIACAGSESLDFQGNHQILAEGIGSAGLGEIYAYSMPSMPSKQTTKTAKTSCSC